jgi:precorrin-2 dehydrogenase / sirohydrochlorin ferrochelatase
MPVEATVYPVNLVLDGRRVLVVGGGRIAARKVEGLVACGADVHVVAVEVGAAVRALGVSFEERAYARGEVAGYRLALAATDDPAVNAAVFADGEAAGVWVNSADDPMSCSFTLPGVVRRGALTVAVSTGGHSPALSAWLRARLEAELGPEYGVLLELLAVEREALKAQGRSTEGLDWQKALESDMLTLIKTGKVTEARERLQACLSSS